MMSSSLRLLKACFSLAEVIGLSPEGRGVPEAHVTIANEFLEIIPEPKGADILDLNEIAPIHTKK